MDSKYVSIIQYARDHNISDMTVRRRIKTGKLYAVLKEGKYFIPLVGVKEATPAPVKEKKIPSRTPSFDAAKEVRKSQFFDDPRRGQPVERSSLAPKEERPKESSFEPRRRESSFEKKLRDEPSGISDERVRKIDRLLSSSSPSRSSLESKKLIELCEKVLGKIEKSEFFLEEKFFAKFDSIESELNILCSRFEASNLRVGRLEKKIEELKMLVDIMESEGLRMS